MIVGGDMESNRRIPPIKDVRPAQLNLWELVGKPVRQIITSNPIALVETAAQSYRYLARNIMCFDFIYSCTNCRIKIQTRREEHSNSDGYSMAFLDTWHSIGYFRNQC